MRMLSAVQEAALNSHGGREGSDVHILGCHSSPFGPAPSRLQLGAEQGRVRVQGTDQLEPCLRFLRVSTDGRREGGQAPWPRRRSPRFPACPAEAETRQRLLRTVKKEVGVATPG